MFNHLATNATKKLFLAFVVCFLSLNIKAQLVNGQRYVALMLLNLGDQAGYGLDFIRETKAAGANAIHLTIKWNVVYPTATSAPKWEMYDQQIALCKELGLKVAIRIHLCRNTGMLSGFWSPTESMKDDRGQVLQGIYGNTSFSFADRIAVEKARIFVKEVCQRYNNYQNQGIIGWMSVANNATQELGYHQENWPNFDHTKAYGAIFDYSDAAIKEFGIWLERKYKKIERLNLNWKTNFLDFNNIPPPSPTGDLTTTFLNAKGRDWYVFRHLMLRTFIEKTTETIRQVNPKYKVVADFGSVFDEISLNRGTYGFLDLTKNVDGIKINDDLYYDHRFSMDIIRSNAGGKWVMNEVFYDRNAPNWQAWVKDMHRQVNENFENGANWVSVVLTDREQFDRGKEVLAKGAATWLNKPLEPIYPSSSMTYTLSNIIDNNYKNGGIYSAWAKLVGTTEPRKPVNIKLIEDILADSLQGTLNSAPFVKNVFPIKTVAVNTAFSYKIPFEIFDDLDGKINRVEMRTMPSWLQYQNGILSGTPPRIGNYTITLRAIDDDGAWVETSGIIVVDNTGKVNQKPFLKKKINTINTVHKQNFAFGLLDSLYFGDNDGFIARIEAQSLPSWAEFKKGVLIGTPPNIGNFTIKITAFDDENASVSADVTLVVEYPQVRFDLYQGGQPGTRRYIQRLQNNQLLTTNTLPNLLNIYANCDVPFDSISIILTGPYYKKNNLRKFPYVLFDGNGGFPLVVGTYQLQGVAFSYQKTILASTTINFKIANIDPVSQQPIEVANWTAYPNPFEEVVNLKLPKGVNFNDLSFFVVNLEGKETVLNTKNISFIDQLVSIRWRETGSPKGHYWLKITQKSGETKIFKILNL